MGNGESRPQQPAARAAAGERTFYLVMGGPPIRYMKEGGPLIFNVDLPKREGPELVEESASLKNLVNVATKHPMKLVAVDPHDYKQGFRLSVLLDATVVPTSAKLYVGVELEAKSGEGLLVKPQEKGQSQFLLLEADDFSNAAGNDSISSSAQNENGMPGQLLSHGTPTGETNPPMPQLSSSVQPFDLKHHTPIMLHNLAPSVAASELTTPNSLKACPILLRVEYCAEVEVEGREGEPVLTHEKRILYTAFNYSTNEFEKLKKKQEDSVDGNGEATGGAGSDTPSPSREDPDKSHEEDVAANASTVRIAVIKQFLECHTVGLSDGSCGDEVEVYELDDIFDLAGEPSSVAPSRQQTTASVGGDVMGESVPGENGDSPSGGGGDLVTPVVDENEEDDDDANVCVVCLTNPKDTVILPCRHMCLCGECAALLRQQSNKCPICRHTIEKLMTRKV